MSNYSLATKVQWHQDAYPGAPIDPDKGVLHTTEGPSWPSYDGGKTSPTYTARPSFQSQRLIWRAHRPDERSSRALVNKAGGVETNRDNAIQVELVGTCDPKHRNSWGGKGALLAGRDYIYWPEAPAWALRDLAAFIADMRTRHGIPARGPAAWVSYPASYGAHSERMTNSEWQAFTGWCGHQHVPENTHGDPGSLNFAAILSYLPGAVKPPAAKPPVKAPAKAPVKAAPKAPAFPGQIKRGSKGAVVKRVQQRLKDRGWKVTVDGAFGPGMEAIVKQFQSNKGLAVDGKVGPLTWAALWKAPIT